MTIGSEILLLLLLLLLVVVVVGSSNSGSSISGGGSSSGPCHHGMARPRVADGGTASNMEGSCE